MRTVMGDYPYGTCASLAPPARPKPLPTPQHVGARKASDITRIGGLRRGEGPRNFPRLSIRARGEGRGEGQSAKHARCRRS